MTLSLLDRPTSEGAERWRIAGLRVWVRKGVCEINVKQLGKSQSEVTIFGSARCQDAKYQHGLVCFLGYQKMAMAMGCVAVHIHNPVAELKSLTLNSIVRDYQYTGIVPYCLCLC